MGDIVNVFAELNSIDAIAARRPDIVADLHFTWDGDLDETVRTYLAVRSAPSVTKDAISLGLVGGALEIDGHGLSGVLHLTATGKQLVRRFREQMGVGT